MSRRIRIVVECEDSLHRSFMTRFLSRLGMPAGRAPEIRPRGPKGAVLNHVVEGVRDARDPHVTAHLIILVDGDDWTDEKTLTLVNRRLDAADEAPLSDKDRVLLIVVGRRMDTWIRYLRDEPVTETKTGATKLSHNSEARKPAQDLAEHCRNHRPLTNPLPSLEAACREWNAYRERHGL